ncbi:hypothetical protein MGN70_008620 [Eutypa lata]|nr:hypothetical protein MGN70_008620 [Eutypa lata]
MTCNYTARSRKDVKRHLCSNKHSKDEIKGLHVRLDKFLCTVLGCKFASNGIPRRDNFRRHMKTVHNIEIETQRSGRGGSERRIN